MNNKLNHNKNSLVETLVFLDIDGTLLKPNYQTNSDKTESIIKELSKRRYLFCLNSNRSLYDLQPIIKKFKINGPVIGENGAFCYYQKKQFPLVKLPNLKQTIKKQLNELSSQQDADVEFVDTVKSTQKHTKAKANKLFWSVNKYRQWTASIHVTLNGKKNYQSALVLASLLKKSLGKDYQINVSKVFCNVLVSSKKIDKGKAISMVTKKYFPTAKIIMIGDDYADLPVMKMADEFYAVGNADETVKKKADYVAKNLYTKGVDEILLSF